MALLGSLNFNMGFCSEMREMLIPSFLHFNFVIPDVFTFLRLPPSPIRPNAVSTQSGWLPRFVMPVDTLCFHNTGILRLSAPKKPNGTFYSQSTLLTAPDLIEPTVSSSVKKYVSTSSRMVDNSYSSLSIKQALRKAESDANLERLCGGQNWSISERSFKTDIPYAKKGTGRILDKVSNMIGEKLVVTSALGTGQAGNPHVKRGYASHHNAENPKLDVRTNGHGRELAAKLKATGYFSRVSLESDHLDIQIDPSKFDQLNAIA